MNVKNTLEHVIQLASQMPDPHDDILTIKGINPAGGHGGSNRDGMPFHLDMAVDWWNTPKDDPRGIRTRTGVDGWACAWGRAWWAASDYEGDCPQARQPLLWLLTHLTWAQTNFPAITEFEQELEYVQRQLEHACGLDPIPTGRTCPSCTTPPTNTQNPTQQPERARGGMLVRLVTDRGVSELLTCTECGGEFTPQGLASLNRLRLDAFAEGKDRWVPRAQARQILGIDAVFLRKWISRGRLEEQDGKINLRHAAQLAVQSRR